MRVLIACEYSGVVRRAFRELGHNAFSCDLLPAEDESPYHIKGDVLEVIWKMGPSPDRWKERSRTYEGIAKAMAEQWGNL